MYINHEAWQQPDGLLRSLTIELLHRDAGQHVAVAVRQRATQVVPLVEQTCRHMVERHLLPERRQEEEETVRQQWRKEGDEDEILLLGFFWKINSELD